MLYSEIVIAGCGNPLFGDDGFGPAVIEELQKLSLPDNVTVQDAGLGGPHFIFTLLEPEVTKKLIIIDCASWSDKEPGTIDTLCVRDLPPGAYRDAHSWDLSEPLQKLDDKMDITIIGCQPAKVTFPDMDIGLSNEVQKAIPDAVRKVLELIGVDYGTVINVQEDHQPGTAESSGSLKAS